MCGYVCRRCSRGNNLAVKTVTRGDHCRIIRGWSVYRVGWGRLADHVVRSGRLPDRVASEGSREVPGSIPGVPSNFVSRCGLAVRRLAGKQKDLGSIRFGSPFSSLQKIVVYGHCLVTLPTQLMKTLKWPTQLPTLMKNHSGGDSATSRC